MQQSATVSSASHSEEYWEWRSLYEIFVLFVADTRTILCLIVRKPAKSIAIAHRVRFTLDDHKRPQYDHPLLSLRLPFHNNNYFINTWLSYYYYWCWIIGSFALAIIAILCNYSGMSTLGCTEPCKGHFGDDNKINWQRSGSSAYLVGRFLSNRYNNNN